MAGLFDYEDPEAVGRMAFAAGLLNAAGPQKMPVSVGQALSMGLLSRQQAATEAGQSQRRNRLTDAQIQYQMMQMMQMQQQQQELQRQPANQATFDDALRGSIEQQDFGANLPKFDDTGGQMPPAVGGPPMLNQQKFLSAMAQYAPRDYIDYLEKQKAVKPDKPTGFVQDLLAAGLTPGTKDWDSAMRARIAKETSHPPMAAFLQSPEGFVPVDARYGGVLGKPVAQTFPREQPSDRMSPTLQKRLIEVDETINEAELSKKALNDALQYNTRAYSGYFASSRAQARSNFPGQSPAADATVQYENIINSNALQSLKTLFGGQPTEGERKVLLELQASVSKTPEQRQAIINRAMGLVDERVAREKKLGEGIRAGRYSTQGAAAPRPSGAGTTIKFDAQGNPVP